MREERGGIDLYLAGVSLWPGSESIKPITLQVSRMITTTQKMMQLVTYITMAGKVMMYPTTREPPMRPSV